MAKSLSTITCRTILQHLLQRFAEAKGFDPEERREIVRTLVGILRSPAVAALDAETEAAQGECQH